MGISGRSSGTRSGRMPDENPTSAARDETAYHELCAYTLGHGGRAFVHQHVVDAWAAQRATAGTKPIALTFALVGLYLHLERGFTGREVQRAHMVLARVRRPWPTFAPPAARGAITAADVLAAAPGLARDAAIDAWCAAVWAAYAESRAAVMALLEPYDLTECLSAPAR